MGDIASAIVGALSGGTGVSIEPSSTGGGGDYTLTSPPPVLVHGPYFLNANSTMSQLFWGGFAPTQWVGFEVAPLTDGSLIKITDTTALMPDDGVIRYEVTIENIGEQGAQFNILLVIREAWNP